jgi:hypothetical protein
MPAPSHAQDAPAPAAGDGPETARMHLGPVGLTPRIALTNVGIDTNVLNQDVNPQRDVTMTFNPGMDAWLRVGRAQFSSRTGGEFVYFRKFDSQRSIGFNQQARVSLGLTHLAPFAQADYIDTFRRPNAEIDTRVEQTTKALTAGVNLRVGWRASVDLGVRQQRLALADNQFLGVSLAHELDRDTRALNADLRLEATPLTTFVVKNTVQRDRFLFSPTRDADSFSVVPGFEFKPLALLSGKAFAGFRHFAPLDELQPAFNGIVASVSLSYLASDSTRLNGTVDRDVDYSFEPAQPYFLSTGGTVSLMQAIAGSWDAVGRIGRRRLAYRDVVLSHPGDIGRLDRLMTYGVGLGYRLGIDARIGVDINYGRRLSPISGRRYNGFQFGGSFTYGS